MIFTSECRPIIAVVADVARLLGLAVADAARLLGLADWLGFTQGLRILADPATRFRLHPATKVVHGVALQGEQSIASTLPATKIPQEPFFSLLPLLPPVPSFGCGRWPRWVSSVAFFQNA